MPDHLGGLSFHPLKDYPKHWLLCHMGLYLHPRKWRTRAPVLTGGPGAAPGGVASKNGWVYMRVQGGFISYSRFVCVLSVGVAKMAV